MRHHADPDQAPAEAIELVRLVAVGDALADLCTGSEPGAALLAYREQASWFDLDEATADALISKVEANITVMETVFDLHGSMGTSAGTLLARANEALTALSLQAAQDASRLATENRELAVVAATDPLTGVANRRQFADNLWFDMSTGLVDDHHPAGGHACMPVTQAVRAFRKVGVDRIMYGSDGRPGGDSLYGARQIQELPFTDDEKEQILSGNAKRFFNLPEFDWSGVRR